MKKRPIDYFRMFLADTALFGARPATVCGLEFFGLDNIVFASDTPFEPKRACISAKRSRSSRVWI